MESRVDKIRGCLLLFSLNVLFSRLILKNLKIKIYRSVILPTIGTKLGLSLWERNTD
jgi:hypothetical protein